MKLPQRFSEYFQLTNSYLDKIFPGDETEPQPIFRAMRYSVFAGGKRLRSILCLAAAESLGGQAEALLPVAAAIEMLHTYSLIHDDLPSMDNDDFRRGKPTNHKVFGEAIAILAGDALLTQSMDHLANASYDAEIRCRLIAALTKAAGTKGMIGGQVSDIRNDSKQLTRLELEKLQGMKTAALLAFSASAPAVVLQSGQEAERIFAQYGEALGLAFQIVDDLLDVEGRTEIIGKTAGKDHKSNKTTYPSLMGVEESRALASDLVKTAIDMIQQFDPHSYMKALAQYVLERDR
jgi:geranylgeranyl diphosphate synthase type II